MQVIVVNGGVLKPLTAQVGDRIILQVTNRMTERMSIHFHGMLHHQTNTQDGVDGTTQRPIMPNGEQAMNGTLAKL